MKKFFSIIIPSFLGHYKHAASNREEKLIRAVESVMNQSYQNFELIVVADGCEKTPEILKKWIEYQNAYHPGLQREIKLIKIPKQPMFSSAMRNAGLQIANSEYTLYLDIDDYYALAYLASLHSEITNDMLDWYWCDEFRFNPKTREWERHYCNVRKLGNCGTDNIIHKTKLCKWPKDGYGMEDWYFIKQLVQSKYSTRKIDKVVGYYVAHRPNEYDL